MYEVGKITNETPLTKYRYLSLTRFAIADSTRLLRATTQRKHLYDNHARVLHQTNLQTVV